MSTKNLARTVIEGGRCGHYKAEVSDFRSKERASQREYLRLVTKDPDEAEGLPQPKRDPSQVCFADKTSPVRKLLDSRVGKSWAKTFSMISERFDSRTVSGRHIVKDHVLPDIALNGEHLLGSRYWHFRYFVDQQGLLQKVVDPNPIRRWKPPPTQVPAEKVFRWLGNRKVGRMGARLVWYEPSRDGESIRVVKGPYGPIWAELDATGNVIRDAIEGVGVHPSWAGSTKIRETSAPYRQTGLVSKDDEAFFLTIEENLREKILRADPGKPNWKIFRS